MHSKFGGSCIVSAKSRYVMQYLQYKRTPSRMISIGERRRLKGTFAEILDSVLRNPDNATGSREPIESGSEPAYKEKKDPYSNHDRSCEGRGDVDSGPPFLPRPGPGNAYTPDETLTHHFS
jgi:hypothetical protein